MWLALVVIALSPAQSFAAEEHVALDIHAGQTYTLIDLDPDTPAEITFADHHPFTLQCPAPGSCIVLGTEAGHGSVRTGSKAGATIIYDVRVSAVARPDEPLEPGQIPQNTTTGESSAAPLNDDYNSAAAEPATAHTEVSLVSEAPSSEKAHAANKV